MVIRVNTIDNIVEWRWSRMLYIGVGTFFLSFVWRYLIKRKEAGIKKVDLGESDDNSWIQRLLREPKYFIPSMVVLSLFVLAFPFVFSLYQTNIMITALMYVMLGLGLNIVVGLGGILNLGYAAFYMVGAYSYALLNQHFGMNFWIALPIGAALSTLLGVLLALPLLQTYNSNDHNRSFHSL